MNNDEHDAPPISEEEYENLSKHVLQRMAAGGNLNPCGIIVRLEEVYLKEIVEVDPVHAAVYALIQPLIKDYLHQFGHFIFEYGRQFELDARADFSDLSVEDL